MTARRLALPLCLAVCCACGALAPAAVPAQEPAGAPAAGTRYYLSNELGMSLEEIGWYRREEAVFVLAVRPQEGGEVRILLKEGREIKRWELSGDEERTYEEGELVERVLLDAQGRRRELWEFEGGSLVRRTELSYSRPGEISSRCYDGEGNLLYADTALLSRDKGLREVRRESAQGERSRLSLSMPGDRLVEERSGGDGRGLVRRYDAGGRLTSRERWAGDGLEERETLRYEGDGRTPVGSTVIDYVAGTTAERTFDEDGYLRQLEVRRDDEVVEQTRYERDAEGRATLIVRRGPAGIEQWRCEYDEQGELLREEYRVRGSLERVTVHEGEGRSVEELYRDGTPFMRVVLQEGEKVREEFLKNGAVVRTREYR